ncbi:MAG: polysaccharide biosynthesis protein, partial [Acidiferrobacteraceae bacterium]
MNHDYFKNQTIVVTGASGTVGSELVDVLLREHHPAEIRILDNNESAVFLQGQHYAGSGRVSAFLGDVRDRDKLEEVFAGAHTVFHLAAHKHVYLAEYNSFDTVQTNIHGVQNVIHAARRAAVARVLFTSSDKAVNPTSVMGTTKLMGEKLITAANITGSHGSTVLSSVRFGNVLGSRGSVVPIFASQIHSGGPVTITDELMTRFIMSVAEAAALVIRAIILARGGEVFITKMPVVKIVDLAQAMIELLAPRYGRDPADITMTYVGSKPGEKLYEELMSDEETHRSQELEDMFVTLPA